MPLSDFLDAFADGIHAIRGAGADTHRGSLYDQWAGTGALLFNREVDADRDLFRAISFDTAEGEKLAARAERRLDTEPTAATFGMGVATLARADAARGEGTVFAGTRVALVRRDQLPLVCAVADDVPVAQTTTRIDVPIRSLRRGRSVALDVRAEPGTLLRLDDPLWDPTWTVLALACSEGTDAESPISLRQRARETCLRRRKGYARAMTDACIAEGASNVALFASNYAGDDADVGLNFCYVGDAGASASDALVRRCQVSLERFRVVGADLQVRPMARSPVVARVVVHLWDEPTAFDAKDVTARIIGALVGYFDHQRASAFGFALDAMGGAVMQASDAVQSVAFTLPAASADVATRVGDFVRFPPTLLRYTLASSDVSVRLLGPT
jgi:hypothetical protein